MSEKESAIDIAQKIHDLSLVQGLDEQTLKDTMDSLQAPLNDKLEGIAYLMYQNSKDIASIQVDIDKYQHAQKTKKALQKQNDRLHDYMTEVIMTTGKDTVRTGKHLFKVKHKSYVTNILDEAKIPANYKEQETSWKVDKASIRKAIRSGEQVPGAEVVETHKTIID